MLQLGFGSVNELLLYRIDALDAEVRSALHLAAVLGTEFDLIDAALTYEHMFRIRDSDRLESAMGLCSLLEVAVDEGILEQSFAVGDDEDDDDHYPVDEDVHASKSDEGTKGASLGNVTIPLKGRRSHPLYAENRLYRFTHDSWKTSILGVMLDGRKAELHENVAMTLEHKLIDEGDLREQSRLLSHWIASGNFAKAADLGIKIGSQMMILGLNPGALLIFDDVLDIFTSIETEEGGERYGGKVLNASCLDFCIIVYLCYSNNISFVLLYILRH